jgi:hypothetical protein
MKPWIEAALPKLGKWTAYLESVRSLSVPASFWVATEIPGNSTYARFLYPVSEIVRLVIMEALPKGRLNDFSHVLRGMECET